MPIRQIEVPVIPVKEASAPPPPTRNLAPPVTRGLEPPVMAIPGWDGPNPPELPINAPIDYGVPVPEAAPTPAAPPNIEDLPEAVEEEERSMKDEEEEEEEEKENDGNAATVRELPDGTRVIELPFDASTTVEIIGYELPVPKPEVVMTATTTAATSAIAATGAAIFAKPMFDAVMKWVKPLVKTVVKKLLKKKEKVWPEPVQLELPDQLRFGSNHQEPLRLHRGKSESKEKSGDKKSQT